MEYFIIQLKTKPIYVFKALLVDVDEIVKKKEDTTEDATSTDTTEDATSTDTTEDDTSTTEIMEQDPLAVVGAPVKMEEPMTSAVKIEVDVDFEVDV